MLTSSLPKLQENPTRYEAVHLVNRGAVPPERELTLQAVDIEGIGVHFPVPNGGFADVSLVLKCTNETSLVVVGYV